MFGLPINQVASIGVLAAAVLWYGWQNRAAIVSGVSWLWPQRSPAVATPDNGAAFQAAQLLIAHFELVKCEAGLRAAREAGKHLFDAPGEAHS